MNFLPIILIAMFLLKGNGQNSGGFTEILKNIDLNGLLPLLETLGVDKSLLDGLSPDVLQNLQNGNFDISSLLPVILPIINSFSQGKSTFSNTEPVNSGEGLSPVKDVINDELYISLENYFSA